MGRSSRLSGDSPERQPRPVAVEGEWPGPGLYAVDIVGESRYQEALELICGGRVEKGAWLRTVAVLILEDDNPHDNQAVRVDIEGHVIGYLRREHARQYRKRLGEAGHPQITARCKALIVGGWDRGGGDRGHFGVKLDLPKELQAE
jgi:hypothetical protein